MSELELYFQFKCERGLEKRGLSKSSVHVAHLKEEIATIQKMGFCGYLLIVADIIEWSRSQNIPIGPGRGSAAGSLAVYCLGITHLDPLKYNLIFERFLNPARVSMPDIDLDFCEVRRKEVIEYLRCKYGSDCIAHIGTYGCAKAKASVRDVARVRGLPYQIGDKLSKMLLEPVEGKPQSLSVCYEKVPELALIRNGPQSEEKDVLIWAEQLEDRKRAFGKHASGIVISDIPVRKLIPLYPDKDGAPTTQFEMNTVETVGLIKFDCLGLRALTTIQRTVDLIFERHGIRLDPFQFSLEDQETFDLLCSGDVSGVFQLEGSSGIRDLLVNIQPRSLDDLALLVAIYRPGPLGSEMLQHFLEVRKGQANPEYLCPELEPILKVTGGMLIYQEQILEICKQLAGYTMAEADLMRRAIGKKKQKEMDAQEVKFKKGIVSRNIAQDIANKLWNDINNFAAYGFNKSHAVCYGYISYQTAYLKTHYPLEFICACLISDSDEVDKVIQYISYCQSKDIQVKPPEINRSKYEFSVSSDDKSIRFGLGAIKNLGKPVEDIITERQAHGEFKDIIDFARRSDLSKLNRKKLESLVLAGAFDSPGVTRSSLMAAVEEVIHYRTEQDKYNSKLETYQKRSAAYQVRQEEIAKYNTLDPKDRKSIKKPAPVKLPVAPIKPNLPYIPSLPEMSLWTKLNWEKELLGYYVTGHPLDLIKENINETVSLIKEEGQSRQHVKIIAIPSVIKEITTKKTKKKMAYVTLEDRTGTIEATVLPKHYESFSKLIDVNTPAFYEGEIELTENDAGRLVKLIISSIRELPSLRLMANIPLEFTASPQSINKVAKHISSFNSGGTKVHLSVRFPSGNLWNMGTFSCAIEKDVLEKELKEI